VRFKPVQSSNIEAVAYEDGTLLVRFAGGATYRYRDVHASEHLALMASSSKGAHLAHRIKGKFPTDKLTAEQVAALTVDDEGLGATGIDGGT
jgi:hypothetical protein